MHCPRLHVWPSAHAVPHAPQFVASLWMFTQLSPHIVEPDVHTHAPPEHTRPARHALPQVPQFKTSVMGSTQLRLHSVSVPQSVAQLPERHTEGAGHTAPPLVEHAPQFIGSLVTLTQVAPQRVSPPLHMHALATQLSVVGHALPQLPQWRLFVVVSVQTPEH